MGKKANHPHDTSRPTPKGVLKAIEAQDEEMLQLKLTVRQRRFCEEYIIDYNAAAAAIRAGYSSTHVNKQAYLLKMNKGVQAYIDHLTRSKAARLMSIDPDYVIQRVTEIVTKPEAKDSDKLRGLELLARHLGMFVDRTEITGKDGGAIEVEQRRIEEEADKFTSLVKSLRKSQEEVKH